MKTTAQIMTDEQRRYYDSLVAAALRRYGLGVEFEDWYYEHYQVSSCEHPSGMFSNQTELRQYENRE